MKKIILTLTCIFIFVLSSCGFAPESHNYDAIPYEEYKEFTIEDVKYIVYIPEDINASLDYSYYDLSITSNKEEWLVNAYVDLEYKTSTSIEASQELLDTVYDYIINDEAIEGLSFEYDIKKSGYYQIEEVIENQDKEEIGCGVFIIYMTLLIKKDFQRFYLSVPVYEKILKTKDNYIADPFPTEFISKDSFQKKYS